MITATVISDASFHQSRKGGPAHAGWAAWVRVDGDTAPIKGYGALTSGLCRNSTEAEIYAALNGIWLARRGGASRILVRSDCMTVVDLIHGKLKSKHLITIWQSALSRPDLTSINLTGKHVKGHGTIKCAATYVNDWCDRHARMAQRNSRKGVLCQQIL